MARGNHASDVAMLRDQVAALLDEMADAAGDARFRSASAMVRGGRCGRRPLDDSKALDYAAGLIAMGVVNSKFRACEMAAVMFAPAHQVETMRDRLRRKFRTKPVMSEDGGA